MKEIIGDLIKSASSYDVIIHGCNCFSTMGAGIAKTIKNTYPDAFKIDMLDPRSPIDRLGSISYTNGNPIVVNAYTQYGFKGPKNVEYSAIKSCMKEIKLKFSGKKIGMPLIGAGLAGGDWNIIKLIIEKELKDEDVTVVIWEHDPIVKSMKLQNSKVINNNSDVNLLNDLLKDFE